jgi:hypothetical protein
VVLIPGNGSWISPPEYNIPSIPDPTTKHENIFLFDIEKDPYETTNLASKYPHVCTHIIFGHVIS